VQLSNRAVEVWNMYTARYQRDFPLLKCLELVKNTENPFLQYQQYIHRKIKNVYGWLKPTCTSVMPRSWENENKRWRWKNKGKVYNLPQWRCLPHDPPFF